MYNDCCFSNHKSTVTAVHDYKYESQELESIEIKAP
jgi:hypothetical protein